MPFSISLVPHHKHRHTAHSKQPRRWYFMMGSRFPRRPRFPPMRRGRIDRDEYDFPPVEQLFEELTMDPRDPRVRRIMHHQFAEGYGFDHRFSDRRRSSDERPNPDERRQRPRPENNGDHTFERGLTLARSGAYTLPFRRAFKDLHKELAQAEELYNAILSEYDSDIQTIKSYTPAASLTRIWTAKVRGERDPQTLTEGEDQQANNGNKTFGERFSEAETNITKALEMAATSALRMPSEPHQLSERQRVKFDACESLKQRAHFELQQLLNSMERARQSREACRHLVNQLQQFKETVNPESESNRETFKCSDDDEALNAEQFGE